MKTVNTVSDCEISSALETGARLVSGISKGPVRVLCVHVQICCCVCVFFLMLLNYLVFNLACPCM